MRVLIADDEAPARRVLRELLAEHKHVAVAGEATDGLDAVAQMNRLRPDLVFLDLQMPGLDGFSVARTMNPAALPLLIFCTAYTDRALQAFETGAIDYLLKPVRPERLAAALEKAERLLATLHPQPPSLPSARRIVGRLGADSFLLDPASVIAFQAEGDVVYIVTEQGRYYSDRSLRALEASLDPASFRRVHRSTIINAAHIRKISPLSSKRWLLTLSNGLQVAVSKRLAGIIRNAGGW
jgi:two-component system, LytTR family, response regulator